MGGCFQQTKTKTSLTPLLLVSPQRSIASGSLLSCSRACLSGVHPTELTLVRTCNHLQTPPSRTQNFFQDSIRTGFLLQRKFEDRTLAASDQEKPTNGRGVLRNIVLFPDSFFERSRLIWGISRDSFGFVARLGTGSIAVSTTRSGLRSHLSITSVLQTLLHSGLESITPGVGFLDSAHPGLG